MSKTPHWPFLSSDPRFVTNTSPIVVDRLGDAVHNPGVKPTQQESQSPCTLPKNPLKSNSTAKR